MYKGKTFLGLIPARGGSKGIPHKNIKEINGKPLIQYSIEEAKNSKFLDRIIISTDDPNIADISHSVGGEVPFMRPKVLATDEAKTIDVLFHAISELRNQGFTYDYIVLLQPTQPLRKSWHIDSAIKKIVDNNEVSLVSVSKVSEHPILIRTINNQGILETLLQTNSTVRRQDFPDYYKVNGAIYINKLDDLFNIETSLNDNKLPYIMENKYALDIDEPFDLTIFELILNMEKE